jgi:hypothetical protein
MTGCNLPKYVHLRQRQTCNQSNSFLFTSLCSVYKYCLPTLVGRDRSTFTVSVQFRSCFFAQIKSSKFNFSPEKFNRFMYNCYKLELLKTCSLKHLTCIDNLHPLIYIKNSHKNCQYLISVPYFSTWNHILGIF